MILNRLMPCCNDCPHADIEIDKRAIVNLGQPDMFHTIYCTHDRICKTYLEFNLKEESECKM